MIFCCFICGTPTFPQQKVAYIGSGHLSKNLISDQFYLVYGPSTIKVEVYGSGWNVKRHDMVGWVKDAAHSVISYYGKFPVKNTLITVRQTNSRGVGFGTAFWDETSNRGRININLGKYTHSSDLKNTWTLTHEMVHLTFPLVKDKYNWLTEGIATYAEPIGRMRQGIISKERVWLDLVDGLPKGQPRYGDRGLNNTHTWGRTYWGGAIYCLVADIEIRKASKNRYGLEHALRGIMDRGVTAESNLLSAPQILTLGDKSVHSNVLIKLYNDMKDKPVTVDLEKLFDDLGVEVKGEKIHFNDSAPLAHIRKAIEKGNY